MRNDELQLANQFSKEYYLFPIDWWVGLSIAMGVLVLFSVLACVWALCTPLYTWIEDESDAKSQKYAVLAVTVRPECNLDIRCMLQNVAVLFGLLPFCLPIVFLVWGLTGLSIWWYADEKWQAMWDRSYVPFCAVTLMGFCVVLSELILKNIFKQPRPPQSAAHSYGFPSGHALNTYAVMLWIVLEKCVPGRGPGPIDWWVLVVICAVCVPVPWARYYTGDHSLQQVVCSMFLAGVVAILVLVVFRMWHVMPMPGDGSQSFLQVETSKYIMN